MHGCSLTGELALPSVSTANLRSQDRPQLLLQRFQSVRLLNERDNVASTGEAILHFLLGVTARKNHTDLGILDSSSAGSNILMLVPSPGSLSTMIAPS